MTELIDVVLEMDVKKTQELINSGVDVNEMDEYGKTALCSSSNALRHIVPVA